MTCGWLGGGVDSAAVRPVESLEEKQKVEETREAKLDFEVREEKVETKPVEEPPPEVKPAPNPEVAVQPPPAAGGSSRKRLRRGCRLSSAWGYRA